MVAHYLEFCFRLPGLLPGQRGSCGLHSVSNDAAVFCVVLPGSLTLLPSTFEDQPIVSKNPFLAELASSTGGATEIRSRGQ